VPAPKRAKQKLTGHTPVDAIVHGDKRTNLPTADAQDFIAPELERPLPLRYPRDPTLDPQLVWKGKDELDGDDLIAEAPAIYIQEKIDPRVIIENLRRTSKRPEDEPELTLFESFDGLGELDLVDFYRHQANWSNRMILGDSLNVMASLAEREALRGQVQMIYLDPPYGIRFGSNWQASARKRDVKDGNLADASREVEQIKAFRDTWELGIHSYLSYLRDRLVVAKELLTKSGSCFVQIGDENLHLVRSLMDEVFGSGNFVSLITVKKTGGLGTDLLKNVTDFIVWYAIDRDSVRYRQPLVTKRPGVGQSTGARYDQIRLESGEMRPLTQLERLDPALVPPGRTYRLDNMISSGRTPSCVFTFDLDGVTYTPGGQRSWKTNQDGMAKLTIAGRLAPTGRSIQYVRYLDDFPAYERNNVWDDVSVGTDKIYVVQSPTSIVERCLLMTTDPGDLVVDPTCGSGTTAYVAEQWGRRWITIDTSRVALALARQRLMGSRFPYYLLADSPDGRAKETSLSATPLPDAAVTNDIRHGFVHERVQHVTLKSIANNPDIHEGMSREEIDAAIRRHAEFELLYDKPYEDKKRVRVAGPFTVESLSPHRALAFAGSAVDGPASTKEVVPDGVDVTNEASFVQTILANLRTAGIQNGRKNERLLFDTVDTYAAPHIQAIGVRDEAADGTPKRVGITIGPQYGTVGPSFIKDAARAANRASDIDLLCVLAFAFDPSVIGKTDDYVTTSEGFAEVAAERRLGRVPVLLVRMNADLVMGEELKKTGAGNLFTVFGAPDIEIKSEGADLRVILHGVDVYDPNTGEIRSDDTGQIALWMIDTEYNDESFFVRECYFTGGQDPYARLKRALKAEIDEEAWASLHRTESRPFARPASGKIAVKVINDYGDEVMKVFEVGLMMKETSHAR
jgi:adenine-specific DNA-methyltransferase